jgi:hypothetical protein
MAGLVPAIHPFLAEPPLDVDARNKRGHDENVSVGAAPLTIFRRPFLILDAQHSRNHEHRMTERKTYSFLGLIAFVVIAGATWRVATSPDNSYSLLCKYTEIYRVTATIEVEGAQYKSEVVRQNLTSRDWIRNLNSGGCPETHGTALSFRLKDNRVVLLRSELCHDAIKALEKLPTIKVSEYCAGINRQKTITSRIAPRNRDGFIFDSADAPTVWWRIVLGETKDGVPDIRLVSVTASRAYANAFDDLETVAPGILRSKFVTGGTVEWYTSPNDLIGWRRRSGYRTANDEWPNTVREKQ